MTAQLSLFALGDRADRWSVRTSRRARRLSVRVYPGGRVEIVAPQGASPVIVQRFIGEHRQWIDDRVQAFAGLVAPDTQLPTVLELPAIGRRYSIDYVDRPGPVRVRLQSIQPSEPHTEPRPPERLIVIGPVAHRHVIAVALRRWLCDLAMIELGKCLQEVAHHTQLVYSRLQIRRQRTRWGSCSASGTISLNVSLLFLDPAVMRYLLVHELCHTKQMNHSIRFWSLVAVHEPQYRRLDRALLGGWQQVPWWMFG